MKRIITALIALLLASLSAASEPQGSPWDDATLRERAPRISLENQSISSFIVEGNFSTPAVSWDFTIAAKAPDHIAVRLYDAADGTPFFWGTDRKTLVYDPSEPKVLFGPMHPMFRIEVKHSREKENVNTFLFQFATRLLSGNETEDQNSRGKSIVIDIASILSGTSDPIRILESNEDHFIAEAISPKGNKILMTVSPNRPQGAFSRLVILSNDNTPFLKLNRIDLNLPVPDHFFHFPEKELIDTGLPCRHISSVEAREQMIDAAHRACQMRIAFRQGKDSHLRACSKCGFKENYDWDNQEKQDRINAALLRDILNGVAQ